MKLVVPLAKDDLQRYRLSTDWPQPWLAFVAIIQSFFCSSFCLLGLEKKQSEETDIDKESPVSRLVLF